MRLGSLDIEEIRCKDFMRDTCALLSCRLFGAVALVCAANVCTRATALLTLQAPEALSNGTGAIALVCRWRINTAKEPFPARTASL